MFQQQSTINSTPQNLPMQQPPITPPKKEYARYTMVGFYQPGIAKQKGKPKQTYRDDLCKMNFLAQGDKVEHMHPLAILFRKFIEDKWMFREVIFYDNYKLAAASVANQRVLKIIIREGKEIEIGDCRSDYYDLSTGIAYDTPINKQPNQNL